MGSSTREPTPPSGFGFGQGTQGYQAAPIFMKDGQAFTRTGNGPAQADYETPDEARYGWSQVGHHS